MQSFKIHQINEDKARFVKQNPHLTDMQKQEIIDFIKKNNQADGKLDANKATTMTYDEYQEFMGQWQSGRKVVLKHTPIAHLKEGEDYIRVKLHTKEYLAYIPLSYATAKIFNTKDLGVCHGSWCVGHSSTSSYWNDHIVRSSEVPVYVINKESKWIVVIQPGNDKFDIWDLDNLRSQPHDSIPNFNVKKELISPELSDLYDEIRTDHYDTETEVDTRDAETDYNNLIRDMDRARERHSDADDAYYADCQKIKDDTVEYYEKLFTPIDKALDEIDDKLSFAKNQLAKWEKDNSYKIISNEKSGQTYIFPSVFKDHVIVELQRKRDITYKKWFEFHSIIQGIESMEYYDMFDADTIEVAPHGKDDPNKYDVKFKWVGDPPNEDYKYEGIDVPYWRHTYYADYFTFAERYLGWDGNNSGDSLTEEIDGFMNTYHDGRGGAAALLAEFDLTDPAEYNNR